MVSIQFKAFAGTTLTFLMVFLCMVVTIQMDGTTKMQHVSNVSQCVIEGVAKQQQQQHAEEEERVKREEMGNL